MDLCSSSISLSFWAINSSRSEPREFLIMGVWIQPLLVRAPYFVPAFLSWPSIFTCNLLVLLWRIKLCSLCLRKISGKRVPWRYDTFNERSSNHLRTFFFLLSVHGRHFMLYTLWFWNWTIIRLKKPCCTSIIFIIGVIIVFHERVSFSRVSHGIHLVTWKQSVVRSVQTSRRRGPTLSKDIA